MPIKTRNIEPLNVRRIPFTFNQVKQPTKDKCILSCIGDTVFAKSADIVSATDYSPFGAPLAGRTWQAREYRFGFNGKEKDNETYGDGNEYDFGARSYDSRLGRWFSLDPQAIKMPYESHYSFVTNSPLLYADEAGEVKRARVYNVYMDENGKIVKVQMMQNIIISDELTSRIRIKQIEFMGMKINLKTYDWYDIEEINVNYLQLKPGQQVSDAKFLTSSNNIRKGNLRTNTFLESSDLALSNIATDLEGRGGITFTSKSAAFGNEISKGKAKFENIDLLISVLSATNAASKNNQIINSKSLSEFIKTAKEINQDIEEGSTIIAGGDPNGKINATKLSPGRFEYKWKCVNCGDTTVSRFGHNGLEAEPNDHKDNLPKK
ncbi:MAG: RHS repeat-associated core domain-containing protein [Bacteroidota bacterium]|nr:RHS repeat-associated core domain-containing protein [Bacteroidota bacterium]